MASASAFVAPVTRRATPLHSGGPEAHRAGLARRHQLMRRHPLHAERVAVQPGAGHHQRHRLRVEHAVVRGHRHVHTHRHEDAAVALEDRRRERPAGGPPHLLVSQVDDERHAVLEAWIVPLPVDEAVDPRGSSTWSRGDGMSPSSPEGPGGGSAATRRVHRIRRRASGGQARCRMPRRADERDGDENDRGGEQGPDAERLARQRPAEDDGHQRVDVGDGGEPVGGGVADQPEVGRVGYRATRRRRDRDRPRPRPPRGVPRRRRAPHR